MTKTKKGSGSVPGSEESQPVESMGNIFTNQRILKDMLDLSTDSIALVDLQGHVLYINETFTKIFGWTFAEVKGRKLPMTPASHLEIEEKILTRVAAGEEVQAREIIKMRKDGKMFLARVAVSPVRNESGQVVAAARITRDISSEKDLESALMASENQYRLLFSSSREAVYISSRAGKLIEMNPYGLELFGYSLEELRSLGMPGLYDDPSERGRFVSAIEETGYVKDFPLNFRKKTGELVRTMISASLLKTPAGHTYFQGIIKDVTALLDMEDQLRMSLKEKESLLHRIKKHERWLATTVASIGDALIATDNEGLVVFMNPVAENLTGWNNQEAIGRDLTEIFNIVNETSRRPAENPALRALNEGVIVGLANHTLLLKRGGGEIPIDDSAAPIMDEEGGISGVVLIFRDITERRKAEAELKSMEQKYRALFSEAPVMYVLTQEEGGLPYVADCNESFWRTLGYTRDEVMARPLTDFYTPKSREKALGGGYRQAKSQNVVGERSFTTKDGKVIHTLLHASPEKDAAGETIGVRAIYTDITERRQAEAKQRESDAELRGLFSAIEDRIMIVDQNGRYLKIAPTGRQAFSRPPEKMLGKTYHDLYPAEKADFFLAKVREALDTRRRVYCEYQLPNLAGIERWFSGTILPLEEDKAIWIARDISERKAGELERAALEAQIQQLAKLEAIGRLAGGVAHDFNNILQSISGYVELMRIKLRPEDPLRMEVEEISKAGARAAALTRQLLAFGRKSIIQLEVINLNDLVKDMDRMLMRLIGEDIELVTILAKNLPPVKVDPSQFEHVIINLAINARDAMPQGGKLTMETEQVYLDDEYARQHQGVTSGHYVMLSVSDTGCGMAPEVRERLFEPFFTTKEKGKGTGLGLASIYGIVKQVGGNIWAYSELGQGTTFKIYLPEAGPESVNTRKDNTQGIKRGVETILLVEDDTNVRKLASLFLQQLGYKVFEASQAGEALLLCERWQGPLDLVLTDVVLPLMNGRELVERLKQIRQDFKVLYMSGYTDNVIVHHGVLEAEMHFIQKPFNLVSLSKKVREVLAAKR